MNLKKRDIDGCYECNSTLHPKYQKKGVTAIIFNEMQKTFNKNGYNIVETNPELEENSSIQNLWKNYEHRLHKKRLTVTKKL